MITDWLDGLSPDAVMVAVLTQLGAPLLVIAVVQILSLWTSWVNVARASVKAAGHVGRTARAALALRPVRFVTTMTVTAVVPVAQTVAVGMCYLMGNYLSAVAWQDHPLRELPVLIGPSTSQREAVRIFVGGLRLDAISGAYLVLVVGLLAASYAFATDDTALDRIANYVSFPGLVLLVPAGLGLAASGFMALMLGGLYLLIRLFGSSPEFDDSSEFFGTAATVAAITAVLLVYVFACRAAVFGSRTLVSSWRPAAAREE